MNLRAERLQSDLSGAAPEWHDDSDVPERKKGRMTMDERLKRAQQRREGGFGLQEVEGWAEGHGPEDAPTVIDEERIARAELEQESAQTRIQERGERQDARAEVFALAEGNAAESNEDERKAQELLNQAFAAEKTLRRMNLQGIHDVIRENRLESGRMVRKSDESMGPEEFADRELADRIALRMEQDHSSARDAALAILGEVYVKAAVPLRQLEMMSLSDDLEQDAMDLSRMVQQDSGANYDTTWDYLKRLPDTPGSIRKAA